MLGAKGPNAVKLHLPMSMRIHPVVNVSWVKPYKEWLPGQTVSRPGAALVTEEGHQEWEVEAVLDNCKTKKNGLRMNPSADERLRQQS